MSSPLPTASLHGLLDEADRALSDAGDRFRELRDALILLDKDPSELRWREARLALRHLRGEALALDSITQDAREELRDMRRLVVREP